MDEQENPLERDHCLSVVLPGGMERNTTVHGSKPVMDLLVTLCASYHLNPSDYTVEVLSTNKNNISFKPNSPIGSLEAEKVVLKPRGVEEKVRRPYMPEATVRLLINYNKSHKAVVRVNPRLPLEMLLPLVCDKCEFNLETTVLLRDAQSRDLLDMTQTLNELGLREVFAKDTAGKEPADHLHRPKTPDAAVITEATSPPALRELPKKKKHKENTGFLSLFRRRKKKTQTEGAVSGPSSPEPGKQTVASMSVLGASSSNTLPADMPKKRRAPQPPMGGSQSVPNNLSSCHLGGQERSADSTMRSTKRRAPPPPCANTQPELQADTQVKGTVDSLSALEELRESDDSDSVNLSQSSPSSPHPSKPWSSSSPSRPSFEHYLPSFRGRDFSDARSALAKVLTSSVSKGALVKRLRNSATFPKLYSGPSFASMSPRCPDKGVLRAKLESVLRSERATEWEDPPSQRKGTTTFQVVPSTVQNSYDPEFTLEVPHQYRVTVEENSESDASPEASLPPEDDQTEAEEASCPPDESDSQTPLASQVQASDGPDSPPPPHDVDHEDRTASPLSEAVDNNEGQKEEEVEEEDDPADTSEVAAAEPSHHGDEEQKEEEEEDHPADTSDGAAAELSHHGDEELITDGQINSEEQCEFPQPPREQPASAAVEQSGSLSDEGEAEEEVAQEKEEKEEEEEEDYFPPPPPPVFFNEDTEVMEEEDAPSSSLPPSQPASHSCNGLSTVPTEARPVEPASRFAPSRFAQAVALAVQRTRLQRHGKASGPQAPSGPHSALPSPPSSMYQYGA